MVSKRVNNFASILSSRISLVLWRISSFFSPWILMPMWYWGPCLLVIVPVNSPFSMKAMPFANAASSSENWMIFSARKFALSSSRPNDLSSLMAWWRLLFGAVGPLYPAVMRSGFWRRISIICWGGVFSHFVFLMLKRVFYKPLFLGVQVFSIIGYWTMWFGVWRSGGWCLGPFPWRLPGSSLHA